MQIYFYTLKFISNKYFYYSRNKKQNLIYFNLWIAFKFMKLVLKSMYFLLFKKKKTEFLNTFFLYYDKYNKLHYSDIGMGYNYKNIIDEKNAFRRNVSRLHLIEKKISLIFEKNKTILDVGCGKGENIKYLFHNKEATYLTAKLTLM